MEPRPETAGVFRFNSLPKNNLHWHNPCSKRFDSGGARSHILQPDIFPQAMKAILRPRRALAALSASLLAFLPAIAAAHPGHYHPPGEDDEFDQLRADWLHLHGYTEIILAGIIVTSAVVFHFNKRRDVRIGALLAFGGSLTLLAAL